MDLINWQKSAEGKSNLHSDCILWNEHSLLSTILSSVVFKRSSKFFPIYMYLLQTWRWKDEKMKSEVSLSWSPRNANSRLVFHILERQEYIRGAEVLSKIHSRAARRIHGAQDRFRRRHSTDIFTKNARFAEFVRVLAIFSSLLRRFSSFSLYY